MSDKPWFEDHDLCAAIKARAVLRNGIDTYEWDDADAPEYLQRAKGYGSYEKAIKALDRLILDLVPDDVIVSALRHDMKDKGHGHPMYAPAAGKVPGLSGQQWAARMKPLIQSGRIKVVNTVTRRGTEGKSYATEEA
jgi:hypothetical protein